MGGAGQTGRGGGCGQNRGRLTGMELMDDYGRDGQGVPKWTGVGDSGREEEICRVR